MSHDELPPLERFLEQAARRLGGSLHPIELLQRIQAAAEHSVADGHVANDFRVVMHPADHWRYAAESARVRHEVERSLDYLERERGWSRIGERRLRFESSPAVQEGLPRVVARFTDTTHRPAQAHRLAAAHETQRLSRHLDYDVVLDDGSRFPLTHTPFRVGRGPGNDLVLASLAVSRQHAEIRLTPSGFRIADLGSRNGVIVGGERQEDADLRPGQPVMLGDVRLRLEPRA